MGGNEVSRARRKNARPDRVNCLIPYVHPTQFGQDPALRQSTMEALPQLVLELVCEYLGQCEPHRASLLAFASASRVCRAAARRERFSRVSINIDGAEFDERFGRLECILDEANSRTCIRVLELGIGADDHTKREDDKNSALHASWTKLAPDFYPAPPLQAWKSRTQRRPEEHWQRLAKFISGLHLKDLIWASMEQLPCCILAVLNEQMPGCRLHVHGLDFHSLHQQDVLQDIEDTDYMLATSSCLYSISVLYSRYDESGCANYNGEATLQLSAGLAPNLKHVCMWEKTIMSSGEIIRQRPTRPQWRGFRPQSDSEWREVPETKGQIQDLAIHALREVSGFELAAWECHNDFSVLRSLQLGRQMELDVVKKLADLAEQDGLPRLRCLSLLAISGEYEEHVDAESIMTRLCTSLHPLAELGIVGPGSMSFEAILQRHGDDLQVLCIDDFVLSVHQVIQLRDSCPGIRKLSIEMLRSAGDGVEVRIYQTLGSMRYLESLSLMLKCTGYREDDGPDAPCILMSPSNDEEDKVAMAIAMRQVLINAAVDESLAQSIFQQMLVTHASVKAGLPPKLDLIRLRVGRVPVLNDQTMSPGFRGILAWIGRSWICRRDPRDTHRNEVRIEEVDSNARLCNGKLLEDDIDELMGSEQFADIWKSLWPETSAGWKEDWRSNPLAGAID